MARGFQIEDIRPLLDDVDSLHEKVDALDLSELDKLDKLGDPEMLWGHPDKTILAYANAAYQHIHMPGNIWPNDCSVVTVTPDAAANTFGDFVELVPVNGIGPAPYDCHWVTVTNISATGVYIVEFYIVDNDNLQTVESYLTAFSVARVDNFTRSTQVSVQMPPIGGGKRVGARAKQSGTGAATVSFNIHYHKYDLPA